MLYETLLPDLRSYVKDRKQEILGTNEPFQLQFLAQGEYNINYLLETNTKKLVLRVNTASQIQQENQIKYEYDSLQILRSSGVTPAPDYLDDTKSAIPYGLLTMEYLNGRPLHYETDLAKAARIFGAIHSLPVPDDHHLITEEKPCTARIHEATTLLANIWDSDALDLPVKRFFDRLMDWAVMNHGVESYFLENRHFVINNTEVNSSNFIIGQSNWLIDWEKPVVSDPAQDITQLLSPTTTLWKTTTVLSDEQIRGFLTAYKEQLGIPDFDIEERVRRYLPYLYFRALSWCAHAWVEYNTPGKEILNADTRQKLIQYLEIDQLRAWLRPYFSSY